MKTNPAIFLHTEAAEIDDATKAAMIEAGFLPVKVADLDQVKFIGPETSIVSAADLSAFQRAMLILLKAQPESIIAKSFGPTLAAVLLGEKP